MIALNISKANDKVMANQERIKTESFSDDLFRIESDVLIDLNRVLRQQEIFMREKSMIRWLVDGDKQYQLLSLSA